LWVSDTNLSVYDLVLSVLKLKPSACILCWIEPFQSNKAICICDSEFDPQNSLLDEFKPIFFAKCFDYFLNRMLFVKFIISDKFEEAI